MGGQNPKTVFSRFLWWCELYYQLLEQTNNLNSVLNSVLASQLAFTAIFARGLSTTQLLQIIHCGLVTSTSTFSGSMNEGFNLSIYREGSLQKSCIQQFLGYHCGSLSCPLGFWLPCSELVLCLQKLSSFFHWAVACLVIDSTYPFTEKVLLYARVYDDDWFSDNNLLTCGCFGG